MKYIIIILVILLTGCMNKYHAFDFNSTSNAECAVACEDLMNNYTCFEGQPTYQSSYTNNVKTSGVCSCYIRMCFK